MKLIAVPVVLTLTLSACVLPSSGPALKAQEDAIFACAKEVGDQVFPITTRVSFEMGGGSVVQTAQIIATEKLSQPQADAINACAAARVGAPIATVAGGNTMVGVNQPRATVAVATDKPVFCPPGASTLYGGAQYCVGQ